MSADIWVFLHIRQVPLAEAELGLVAEARRLADEAGGGLVRALLATPESVDPSAFAVLGSAGADGVGYWYYGDFPCAPDELFAQALYGWALAAPPLCILMVHDVESGATAARLGALQETAVLTRAVDATLDAAGGLTIRRPLSDGLLYETVSAPVAPGPIVTFLPEVLACPAGSEAPPRLDVAPLVLEPAGLTLLTRTLRTVATEAGQMALEEAEIVVAGGRGVGQGADFDGIHELAGLLGGVAAGTRPVIDAQLLPFERQIGQTGKNVAPRLLINCGISGANEYTAGIEGARQVIAINSDRRAPIFAWADLGLVGDVRRILPLLIDRLKKEQKSAP